MQENEIAYNISIDRGLCTGCGLCEAFCPMNAFAINENTPEIVNPYACVGCETCAGQCPVYAIRVEPTSVTLEGKEKHEIARALDSGIKSMYAQWAAIMTDVLGLRWHPVAITLIGADEPLPDVPMPKERLRYCQALMAARRGRCLLMPANRHACPDGTSILGMTPVPDKLASGEIYVLFHKLETAEAARRMVNERPCLPPFSVKATCVCPLDNAQTKAQVVAVIGTPEQMMWLSMATSYYTGHRHDFHASGYNAQCVETTLLPLTSKQINISFGCYGCRASSDVDDTMMMMGIPIELMPDIVKGLQELSKRAIPQSRDKVYLPPF